MPTAKVTDAKKNEALADTIIDNYPKNVSGAVGIHALGKLTELLPHEEFVKFAEDALNHALTGQIPEEPEADGSNGAT